MRLAALAERLPVARSEIRPSSTAGHYHVLVSLAAPIPDPIAVGLALHLGGDPLHAERAMMRIGFGIRPVALIVRPDPFESRPADETCTCPSKHESRAEMLSCNVGRKLRNESARDWYGSTPWDPSPWE